MSARPVHWASPEGGSVLLANTAARNGLALSAHQTWAFRRAELTCFAESPFICANGQRATMGHLRTLPPRAEGGVRLAQISLALVEDLTPALRRLPSGAKVALVLGVGERFAEQTATPRMRAQRQTLEATLTQALLALSLDAFVRLEARGHAALAYGLIEMLPHLLAHRLDAVIAGGVDTAYDAEVVDQLLEEGRLFDGENLDSCIPGEGGALSLLALPEMVRRAEWVAQARLEGAAVASEPVPLRAAAPSQAQGLTQVMVALADQARSTGRSVDWWLCDVTGERYRTEEWQQAFPRASATASLEGAQLELLPTHLGDLGAGTLPTGMAVAAEGLMRQDPRAQTCLLTASSVTEARGALLLSALGQSSPGLLAPGSASPG
jgi:3-oxoacyl-[acyl-carrier-protein] synthase-1